MKDIHVKSLLFRDTSKVTRLKKQFEAVVDVLKSDAICDDTKYAIYTALTDKLPCSQVKSKIPPFAKYVLKGVAAKTDNRSCLKNLYYDHDTKTLVSTSGKILIWKNDVVLENVNSSTQIDTVTMLPVSVDEDGHMAYPNYKCIMPDSGKYTTAKFAMAYYLKHEVVIPSSNSTDIAIDIDGMVVTFGRDYLAKVIAMGGYITVKYVNETSPVWLENNAGYNAVIMPMRNK